MEQVDVPKFIPKEEQHLFRDAVIAAHGGKILAALFYLRVFIEQFARRVTGETERRYGFDLMEDYGKMHIAAGVCVPDSGSGLDFHPGTSI